MTGVKAIVDSLAWRNGTVLLLVAGDWPRVVDSA
jgi:hypothetical protein